VLKERAGADGSHTVIIANWTIDVDGTLLQKNSDITAHDMTAGLKIASERGMDP
jgi:hypothetical protein